MQAGSKKEAKLIGIAMIVGLIIGLILHQTGHSDLANYIKPLGTVFIRLLKMVMEISSRKGIKVGIFYMVSLVTSICMLGKS